MMLARIHTFAIFGFLCVACDSPKDDLIATSGPLFSNDSSVTTKSTERKSENEKLPDFRIDRIQWRADEKRWDAEAILRNTTSKPIEITIGGDASKLPLIVAPESSIIYEKQEGAIWERIPYQNDGAGILYSLAPAAFVKLNVSIGRSNRTLPDILPGAVLRIAYSGITSDPFTIPKGD